MSAKREDIDDFVVQLLYEQEGWTQQEIADYYGVSRATIWGKLNPEKRKESYKVYQQSDKGKAKIKRLRATKKGIETCHRASKNYYYKDYYFGNGKERLRKWRNSENGKASIRRRHSKQRQLGSIELNKPFPNFEGHHIDKEHIINIPKELHHSIRHNVWTGQGMEEINTIAFRYITEETFDKLLAGEI